MWFKCQIDISVKSDFTGVSHYTPESNNLSKTLLKQNIGQSISKH